MTDWRTIAIDLYYRNHGSRCVKCSRPVHRGEATIESRDGEYFLMHVYDCEKPLFPIDHLPDEAC